MKKIGMLLMAAVFSFGTLSVEAGNQQPEHKSKVTHNKATQNKATKETAKGVNKVGKGAKHTGYDVTHNKATKKTDINQGNKKYKDKNDI
jgi:hypothetical protein